MAHLPCNATHMYFLWPGPGSAGCSASFATCPISVQGALPSLPAGENSCLMMFQEAEYFPSHVRLWDRRQCLTHVSSVVLVTPHAALSSLAGCRSCEEKKFSPLPVCEITALQGLCAGRHSRVSLCVFWFFLEASCHSAGTPNSLLLSHCPHMSL